MKGQAGEVCPFALELKSESKFNLKGDWNEKSQMLLYMYPM
jgi:hypothetical protein